MGEGGGPVIAMDNRYSFKQYPRVDKVFLSKKSLNFDLMKSKVMIERKENACTNFMTWLAYGLTGIGTGFVASLMVWLEETSTVWRANTVDSIISGTGGSASGIWKAYAFFALFSLACTLVASLMTVYWGPGANGSGVAELIGYMNGVNYPGVFGFATFFTKALGVVLAVVGGLTVGKEGPLAHIGANVGCFVPYIPCMDFNFLRNDSNKRHLIAAGTSAGVAAAFGAPIGGTLFSYEMSMSNTFWKFSIIWKVFFTCALSCFSLAFFTALYDFKEGGWAGLLSTNSGVLKFGVGGEEIAPPTLKVMPAAFFIGATCGFLGGMFVVVNNMMGFWRKHYITQKWMRPVEAGIFSLIITSFFFWTPFVFANCISNTNAGASQQNLLVRYTCPEGSFNVVASMFMNTEGSAIRTIISS